MQAFQLKLRPSATLKRITAAGHLMALVLCWQYFDGMVRWAGLAALLMSFVIAWRQNARLSPDGWQKISIDTGGLARITRNNGQEYLAVLLNRSLIHRRACFLCLQYESGKSWLAVLPDMTNEESYRRLLVWARFGRPKADKNTAAV